MCIHGIDIEEVSNCVFFYVFYFNYHFFAQTKQTTATHTHVHTLYVQMFMHT